MLVWSGACIYGNRNVDNFKPVYINGSQHLSFRLVSLVLSNDIPEKERTDSGIILNHRYEEVGRTKAANGKLLDSHEFSVQPDGESVVLSTMWKLDKDASEIGQKERHVLNNGFQEIDLSSGKTIFDWDPFANGILLNETFDVLGMGQTENKNAWDYFHINSIDKDINGDYMVSGRHLSTIYKISGVDGHVIWRLGGHASDFVLDEGVAFHWQHDARFRFANETHTVISLFDNESEDFGRNHDIPEARSVGKIIILDHSTRPMTAKMLRQFGRPDGKTSNALGSLQTIGDRVNDANVFVNWAYDCYISEYDAQDRLVLEAKLMSDRTKSYRAFKYPFIGKPTEPPAFKVLPIAYASDDVASAFYVSWNGATEVTEWAFYGGDKLTGPLALLAKVKKHGFETSWVRPGVTKYAYAEALDANGKAIGRSVTTTISPPVIDGQFTRPSPLLQKAKAKAKVALAPAVAGSQLTSLPEERSSEATPEVFTQPRSFLLYGFAIFGLYGAVKNILHEMSRRPRRKGYTRLSTLDL